MSSEPIESNPIVARLIEASGLAPVIAKGVVVRCCGRIGIEPASVTARDVPRLMPHLEPLLRLYLKSDVVEHHLAALRALGR